MHSRCHIRYFTSLFYSLSAIYYRFLSIRFYTDYVKLGPTVQHTGQQVDDGDPDVGGSGFFEAEGQQEE